MSAPSGPGGYRRDREDREERRESTVKSRLRSRARKKARKQNKKGGFLRRKVCRFCADSSLQIDYKDAKALRLFTTQVVDKRGWLSAEDVGNFIAAGYSQAQILEVVLGVAMKTISNYTNHIAGTELDAAFADFAWQAPQS